MEEPSDFITSYRCALTDFDLDIYKAETSRARAYRNVDILFGVLFMLVGSIFALLLMGHEVPFAVGIAFIIYGFVLVTIRTCSFWRPDLLQKPEPVRGSALPDKVRPCYETFARKRGVRASLTTAE